MMCCDEVLWRASHRASARVRRSVLELRIWLLVGCFPFNYARLFFAERKSELRLELDRARHDR